jgi:hypothetical protein
MIRFEVVQLLARSNLVMKHILEFEGMAEAMLSMER